VIASAHPTAAADGRPLVLLVTFWWMAFAANHEGRLIAQQVDLCLVRRTAGVSRSVGLRLVEQLGLWRIPSTPMRVAGSNR
jgi:hypothetical protein